MIKTDATVMLFSDSQQDRASAYHRGKPVDVVSLLAVAGINDPAFGEMIIHAALTIVDELEKREKQGAEA
jgi:hypothetical protein